MAIRVIGGTWEMFNPDDVMSVLSSSGKGLGI